MSRSLSIRLIVGLLLAMTAAGAARAQPHWKKAYTEYVGKMVGTQSSPFPPGYVGGDMGVSFPVGNRVFFTVGDMAPRPWRPSFYDALAATDRDWHRGDRPPELRFATTAPPFLAPPGVDFGCNNGPFEGFSHGGDIWLFYATDWYGGQCPKGLGHRTLALVRAQGQDFQHLATYWKMPTTNFQIVSVVADGGFLYVFGSGQTRKSSVYLARVPMPERPGPRFLDPAAWRFYDGHGGFTVDNERDAVPVVRDTCVGELSVRRHPRFGAWMMMSGNCIVLGPNKPDRGFVLRVAPGPTGPWNDPYPNRAGVVWEPLSPGQYDDPGYTTFMHANNADPRFLSDDGLSGYGRERVWGGEYGPQMIPEFFTQDAPGIWSIYYTTSSWNPYLYHLMHTVMVEDGHPVPVPPVRGRYLPPAHLENPDFAHGVSGWTVTGCQPAIANGRATVPPRSGLGQEFAIDAQARTLAFQIAGESGGRDLAGIWNVSAMLLDAETGDILRRTWPINPQPNDAEGHPVAGMQTIKWNLVPLRGRKVKLVVANDEDRGNISAWGFEIIRGGAPVSEQERGH